MYSFTNDYSEGATPEIYEALLKANLNQMDGYSMDEYCASAASKIKKVLENDNVDVHFIPGGTPANILGICACLKPYEAVIAVDSGHINVHETGAIEGSGHKILTAKGYDGKISAQEIRAIAKKHADEHMVKPGMVFISDSTEFGTIYTKEELKAISDTCHELGLYLYLDGARIACAMAAKGNDLTLKDICELTDIFYIGGTKNGCLLGEAMVIKNDTLKKDFRYLLKQKGQMLAKGWILGLQFDVLFTDDLYLKLAKHANKMTNGLLYACKQAGIKMFMNSPTNQIFPIIRKDVVKKLQEKYSFNIWDEYDEDHLVIRLVCSWATKEEAVLAFYKDILALNQ